MPVKPRTFRPVGASSKEERRQEQRQAYENTRGTAAKRGYTWRWAKYSAWFLSQPENVLCFMCGARQSKQTDHIIAVDGANDPLFWPMTNHQGLCRGCHNRKGARFDGLYGRPRDESEEGKREIQRMLEAAAIRAEAIEKRRMGVAF